MFKLRSVSGSVRWSSCGWWVTVLCSCTGACWGLKNWTEVLRERSCLGGRKYGEEASVGCRQIRGWLRVRKMQLFHKWLRMLEASGCWLLCLTPGWGKRDVLVRQNLVPVPLPHCPGPWWHLAQGICNQACSVLSELSVTFLEGPCSGNWAPVCSTPGCQFQTVLGEPYLISCTSTFSVWAVKRRSVRDLRCCGSTFPASPDPAVSQGNLCYPF